MCATEENDSLPRIFGNSGFSISLGATDPDRNHYCNADRQDRRISAYTFSLRLEPEYMCTRLRSVTVSTRMYSARIVSIVSHLCISHEANDVFSMYLDLDTSYYLAHLRALSSGARRERSRRSQRADQSREKQRMLESMETWRDHTTVKDGEC